MPTLSPARTICLGFAAFIALGTLLLMLPTATASGEWNDWLVALFTSTSAVSVTGLVVVDTGTYYSPFGQAVICLLFQLGGLGYMSATTLLLVLVRRRISFRERLALQEAVGSLGGNNVGRLVLRLAVLTLGFEVVGAALIAPPLVERLGWGEGLWSAVFHSVSAFNNAGFALPADGLIGWQRNAWVLGVLAVLIVAGGLGYQVWLELFEKFVASRFKARPTAAALTLQTRVVVGMSALLIAVGTAGVLLTEVDNAATLGGLPPPLSVLNAVFHSISARTAGFNAVPIDALREATWFWLVLLMIAGASPASTGGGLKTTTIAVILSATLAVVRGRDDVLLLDRRLSSDTLRSSVAVLFGSLIAIATALLALTRTDPQTPFLPLLFEVVSAFCTVGLSTGITPRLSVAGQLILILTMYSGRVGFLLLAQAFFSRGPLIPYRQPEERILVG